MEWGAGSVGAAARTGYRPEIDGLRAVAIIPVVLFHAGVPGFAGGFVGVDVFFVISGYLITGILARDLAQGGVRFRPLL
jgi:peptidoglycan/LPS O-acetylase OafA/YrhL